MIVRIWHGWTSPANADAYETLLKEEIFSGIGDRKIPGYQGIQLLRRNLDILAGIVGGACRLFWVPKSRIK